MMKRKIVSVCLIIMMAAGLLALIVYKKKNENSVDPDKVNIENKLATVNADAIFYIELPGGECIEYLEFHICYDALKVYEYVLATAYYL